MIAQVVAMVMQFDTASQNKYSLPTTDNYSYEGMAR